ncbi:hypothetical protein GCM10028857_26430 [Salinarchaeum chitinilyticum]
MDAVPESWQFGYALLATATAFGVWRTWFGGADGIWIMIGAIGLFALLAFVDGLVLGRIRQGGDATVQESGESNGA